MDVYMTEEEKVEAIKKWLKENGWPIIIGVALALGASYGWRLWKAHKTQISEQSSVLYEQMLGASLQKKDIQFQQLANYLIKDYASTPYAALAAMMQARGAVTDDKLPEAQEKLQWVVSNSKQPVLRQVARIRLARVLLAEKKPEAALEMLKTIDDKTYVTLIDEVRGDAFSALKKKPEARAAYQSAIAASSEANLVRPLLEMKWVEQGGVKNNG